MSGIKDLLDEPDVCGECGAELEWSGGRRVCSADCMTAQIDREERLASNRQIRAMGWDAFHDGAPYAEPPLAGAGAEAWQRGWKLAERERPRP